MWGLGTPDGHLLGTQRLGVGFPGPPGREGLSGGDGAAGQGGGGVHEVDGGRPVRHEVALGGAMEECTLCCATVVLIWGPPPGWARVGGGNLEWKNLV